jgi:hypothetical protein
MKRKKESNIMDYFSCRSIFENYKTEDLELIKNSGKHVELITRILEKRKEKK